MSATYLEAAEAYADLVAALPRDLTGPGLGVWDLRALVGHTSRALITVSTYLRTPAETVDLDSAVDYLAGLGAVADDPDVAARGVAAGEALGDDPAGRVRELAAAVRADLADADPDQLVATVFGGMRLRDYLPTRTFELVVHGLDTARAASLAWAPPAAALAESVQLAAALAVRQGDGVRLLEALTGRGLAGCRWCDGPP